MNERIEKLLYQSCSNDPTEAWYINPEKFAELIVRECADIASINAHQYQPPGDYVLKHFGVAS